ncbi:MAG: lysine--tRNA ligase [Parcubacteria group bacterium]|nr:lysine--tRNA ligase [Parcubacteria group bacterium]
MLEDIIRDRERKLDNLRKSKLNPYPARVRRTHSIGMALKDFEALAQKASEVFLVGRVLAVRNQGGVVFADIRGEGGKIQAVLKKEDLGNFEILKENLDVGDFIEVGGRLFVTNRGERSIAAKDARIVVKSLQAIPSEWYGLKDVEERFRKRYLDIFLNKKVSDNLRKRSKTITKLRKFLDKEGFAEVETPTLQPIPGGAKARPFVTHHNALDVDFYLRIAPELYLKRLLTAGWEKIYEIGKVFRNEGMDRDHNPEFTELELYWAYQDYNGLMDFTERMLKNFISKKSAKWPRITFAEAFSKYANRDFSTVQTEEIDEIFKKEVRPKISEPTFVIDHPKSISPLAKAKEDDPAFTERFQLIVEGTELVNGFSELNDPVDQRQRMEEQERRFRAGDQEESRFDADFVEALEYGMPPAAGLGMGIDRLAVLVTGVNAVKEIIIFPTLRPKKQEI